jgi:hypothetical protein
LPSIKIDLDPDTYHRLLERAVEERRPIPWQAEVLLIRALAVPVNTGPTSTQPREVPCATE